MAVNIPEQTEATSMRDQILGDTSDEPINLFGEEEFVAEDEVEESEGEISEEDESEDEAESDEEESDDEPDEEETEEDDEEDKEEESNPVAENLKKALHAERTKRKEATEAYANLQAHAQATLDQGNQYKQAYDSVIASLKENGLEDLVELPQVESPSPEVLEARQMKQAQEQQAQVQKFYEFVRTEATSVSPEYTNVDLSNEEHGVALTQIITAAVVSGVSQEQAVADGMKVLNSLIANAKKEALKNRQPAVKPKSKPKARTKQASSSSRSEMIKKGDFDSLFASMGKQMAKGD